MLPSLSEVVGLMGNSPSEDIVLDGCCTLGLGDGDREGRKEIAAGSSCSFPFSL